MAIMIPSPIPAKASEGEKKLYEILRDRLDDNFYVWYEPLLNSHRPDFIILGPDLGLLVIEVKGWYSNQIREPSDTNTFQIVSLKDDVESVEWQKSPLRQANDYLDKLLNNLPKYRILQQQQGKHQGKVAFPIGLGVIMSNINYKKATETDLDKILPYPQVVYRDEFLNWQNLSTENLCDRLRQMFVKAYFNFEPLTSDQISTIKGVLNPEMVIRDEPAKTTSVRGNFYPLPDDKILKTLDAKQENLARRIGEGHRIFFGVSGSGKTLLLLARAKLILNNNPHAKVLIVCFNVSLASYLRSVIKNSVVADQQNRILVENFHEWSKIVTGKSLGSQPGINYDEYVGQETLKALSQKHSQKWDAILVDEAHTFVPIWFRCCVQALKDPENGDLMIVADGSQSLYKRDDFTWKEVGIKAVGRTISKRFDLDKNYRNTQEILSAAWTMLHHSVPQDKVSETDEITFPIVLPSQAQRSGTRPEVYVTGSSRTQEQVVTEEIKKLLKSGNYQPEDIAVIHRQSNKKQMNIFQQYLAQANVSFYWVSKGQQSKKNYSQSRPGIRLISSLSSLGLEFKAVFIIWMEDFAQCSDSSDGSILARRQLYVSMTRAQELLKLFICQENALIREFKNDKKFDFVYL
ncbi:MAG: 3'-5' exonuclease [Limnospira sp.]